MVFNIQPYKSANSLFFGVDETEATRQLGVPLRKGKNRRNESVFFYKECSLTFGKEGKLEEITFYPDSEVQIQGVNIFNDGQALSKLIAIDSNPLEYVGVVFFPDLGLTVTGFHNDEEKTVTAISTGRLDGILNKFTSFKLKMTD